MWREVAIYFARLLQMNYNRSLAICQVGIANLTAHDDQGGGKPGPYPIRCSLPISYRVRAGLAPALVRFLLNFS